MAPRCRHHYHYVNSYTGFLLHIESNHLNCPFLHIVLYLRNTHPSWLVSVYIRRQFSSSITQQRIAPESVSWTWANVFLCSCS